MWLTFWSHNNPVSEVALSTSRSYYHGNCRESWCPDNGVDGTLEEEGTSQRNRSRAYDEAGLHGLASDSEGHAWFLESPLGGTERGFMPWHVTPLFCDEILRPLRDAGRQDSRELGWLLVLSTSIYLRGSRSLGPLSLWERPPRGPRWSARTGLAKLGFQSWHWYSYRARVDNPQS